jgi:hypothetical protein
VTAAHATPSVTCVYLAQVLVVAALLTAAFMLMTASELGPMGPLVIAEAFYLAAFASVVQIGLLARSAYKFALSLIEARRADSLAQEM